MDSLLAATTTGPTTPVAAAVLEARRELAAVTPGLLEIPDGRALERRWTWDPDERGFAELRYALYRCAELLDRAAVDAAVALDNAGVLRGRASRIAAAATVARWELHGLLAPLGDHDLDRDPGNAEWTIRQTLAHIVNVQRAYASFTAWWLAQRDVEPPPPDVPDDVAPDFPDEAGDGLGSLGEIRARLDDVLDTGAGRLGGIGDDELAVRARWSGHTLTVGFRMGRWASHLREHTIQVEKTFVMLDRPMREVERLVRHVHAAFGRMESAVFALPPEVAAPAAPIIAAAAREVGETARSAAAGS